MSKAALLLCVVGCVLATPGRSPSAQQTPLGALEPDRFACEADRMFEGAAENDHLGHVMASGDWNGDGLADLLVSGLEADIGPCESGASNPHTNKAWLFLGSSGSPASQPAIEFLNVPVIDDFGPPLAFIGDIDMDTREDIAIGLPSVYHHSPGDNSGEVWIFLSGTTGSQPTPLTIDFAQQNTAPDLQIFPPPAVWSVGDQPHFGFSIARAGDVNGDTVEDLVIGAPGAPQDPRSESFRCTPRPVIPPEIPGRAFIYMGIEPSSSYPVPQFGLWATLTGYDDPLTPTEDERIGDRFGWSVAGVGKVEGIGDAYDDVVVGAPQVSVVGKLKFNFSGPGYAHLYRGQATSPLASSPLPMVPDRILPNATPPASAWMFGHALAGGVDLDGLAGNEILIGAPYYSRTSGSEEGAVYAYTWDAGNQVAVPAFLGLDPITLSTSIPMDPPGPYQDHLGKLGWSLAAFDQPGFGGQYDASALDPLHPEFLTSAFVTGNPRQTQCMLPQGGAMSGRVFVLSVIPAGGSTPEDEVVVQCAYFGEEVRDRLGISIATGDFNGDGLLDVAAGASGHTDDPVSDPAEMGRAYIFNNGTAGP